MPRYFAFRMEEVLPNADPLSEWLVTLAVAMNDLTLVHVRLDEDQDNPELAFYWNRLAISHFTEAALFLDQSAEVEQVSSFVDSLPLRTLRHAGYGRTERRVGVDLLTVSRGGPLGGPLTFDLFPADSDKNCR